jgi:hypothetical protein
MHRDLNSLRHKTADVHGDGRTRVLLAVVGGATTYGELTEATGLNRSTIHEHLRRLKVARLVTWETAPARSPFGARHPNGTLRPLVRAVPFRG